FKRARDPTGVKSTPVLPAIPPPRCHRGILPNAEDYLPPTPLRSSDKDFGPSLPSRKSLVAQRGKPQKRRRMRDLPTDFSPLKTAAVPAALALARPIVCQMIIGS